MPILGSDDAFFAIAYVIDRLFRHGGCDTDALT
jgi:hypothetical protein